MDTAPSLHRRYVILGCLAGALLFSAVIRLRTLDLPLERDEGEYAYMGQLILQGIPPYQTAYTMKFPGTCLSYAAMMGALGRTTVGVRLGFLLVSLATIVLIFLIARRLFDPVSAVAAAFAYSILSTSTTLMGLMGHATHLVVLPAVGGILILLIAMEKGTLPWFWLGGAVLGLSVIMKQPGVFLVVFGIGYVAWTYRKDRALLVRRAGSTAGGALLPLALTMILMGVAGVFDRFWYWTVNYASAYGSLSTLTQGWNRFMTVFPMVVGSYVLLWAAALAGAILNRKHAVFLYGCLALSFAAVCSGLYFRHHYFIVLLPAVSFLIAAGVHASRDKAHPAVPLGAFGLAALISVLVQLGPLFSYPPDRLSRHVYGPTCFTESEKIARYLRENTAPEDSIAVFGSEPQIYFFADRRAATGHIYAYPLMELWSGAAAMQAEMIREVESARPKMVLLVVDNRSWFIRKDSDISIVKWMAQYCEAHYRQVGLVDIPDQGPARYVPGAVQPRESVFAAIYRRKD